MKKKEGAKRGEIKMVLGIRDGNASVTSKAERLLKDSYNGLTQLNGTLHTHTTTSEGDAKAEEKKNTLEYDSENSKGHDFCTGRWSQTSTSRRRFT